MDECYICCDIIEINNSNKNLQKIILKCGHKFHYECIKMSYKTAHNTLCPYCRQPGGKIKQTIYYCKAIINTGPHKGCVCTNKAKYNEYCGKHKKYIQESQDSSNNNILNSSLNNIINDNDNNNILLNEN